MFLAALATLTLAPALTQPAELLETQRSLVVSAAKLGDTARLRELLGADELLDVDVDATVLGTFTPLMITARWGHVEATELLLNLGADAGLGNRVVTPLALAAMYGHDDVVRILLRGGADPNAVGFTGVSALGEATFAGNSEMVEMLLEAGANPIPNVPVLRKEPIVIAASEGRESIMKLLLREGVDVGGKVVTAAFINAAWRGHKEVVELLLSRGVDPNVTDVFGRTALAAATGAQQRSVEELLKAAGATGESDPSPLWAASSRGEASVVEALVEAGANVNETGPDGTTPLIAATRRKNNLRVLRTLMSGGADVNAVDNDGMTPLMWAAAAGETGYVWALLDFEAVPQLRNREGSSALDLARRSGNESAVQLLTSWGQR